MSLKLKKNIELINRINLILYKTNKSNFKLESHEDLLILEEIIIEILKKVEGKQSKDIFFDDKCIISFLQNKNPNWDSFLIELQRILKVLSSKKIIFTEDQFKVLDDIANAIQNEGNLIYKKSRVFL